MLNKMMGFIATLGVIAMILMIVLIMRSLTAKPVDCIAAPDVVRGWHSVSAHPEERMVCGWHQAGATVPSFRCVRMTEVCP